MGLQFSANEREALTHFPFVNKLTFFFISRKKRDEEKGEGVERGTIWYLSILLIHVNKNQEPVQRGDI